MPTPCARWRCSTTKPCSRRVYRRAARHAGRVLTVASLHQARARHDAQSGPYLPAHRAATLLLPLGAAFALRRRKRFGDYKQFLGPRPRGLRAFEYLCAGDAKDGVAKWTQGGDSTAFINGPAAMTIDAPSPEHAVPQGQNMTGRERDPLKDGRQSTFGSFCATACSRRSRARS